MRRTPGHLSDVRTQNMQNRYIFVFNKSLFIDIFLKTANPIYCVEAMNVPLIYSSLQVSSSSVKKINRHA